MENRKKEKKLPDSIILEDEYRKYRTSWMALLGNAQQAFDELSADRDVGDSLPDFENLNQKWLDKFIDDKIAAVMASPYPYDTRIESAEQWRELKRNIQAKLKKIDALRRIDKRAKVEAKGCHLCITNMEELISEKSRFVTPESFQSYYSLVVDVNESIMRLREFESQNFDKKNISLQMIKTMADDPKEFIKSLIYREDMRQWANQEQVSHIKEQSAASLEEQAERNRQYQKEKEEAHAEYLRKQKEQREALIQKGHQVDFATGIKDRQGNIIPVGVQ